MSRLNDRVLSRPRSRDFHLPGPRPLLASLFGWLIRWSERYRERNRLRNLDDRQLRDIGVSRRQIEREADKPFWRE